MRKAPKLPMDRDFLFFVGCMTALAILAIVLSSLS